MTVENFTGDAMKDIAENEYNGSLHAIYGSWEFSEFCEKKLGVKFHEKQSARQRQNICRKFLPEFYRENAEAVKKLQQRHQEKYVDCGYIKDLSHSEKVYDFVLYTNTGSGVGLHIPNEFFAKGRYKPKEGDRISYIEDKEGGTVTFSVRENGADKEIYTIDRNSEEYEKTIAAANKRRSVPGDKLAAKESYLNSVSEKLSGVAKDQARFEAQRDSAIFSGALRRLKSRE